ncbi:MAG: Gfo/Idh/MocA family oxidoreductase [Thermoguttaceae bacterium]|jgi:predicted dehydrogenase|nr:Gfo/Idh/MocA family oxidoreductase [Thermoguttaceae bacterium]
MATNRRNFLKTSGMAAAIAAFAAKNQVYAGETSVLKIGQIGCGGRGCGAVADAMSIDPNVVLTHSCDLFQEKCEAAMANLKENVGDRIAVTPDTMYSGFDGYKKVLESDVDSVILATPQFFRPQMLLEAIKAGKHVFAEKPVAVDGAGIKMVLEATELAKQKGLNIVSGLCNRYYPGTMACVERIKAGAIGDIIAAKANRMGGGLWARPRRETDTEMSYQMTNWVNFCWMASEYINDVTIHQIDVALWCMGDPTPKSAIGMGGRLARREADTGDMYDSMAVSYEFESGQFLQANSRQIAGTWGEAATHLYGTKGQALIVNSGGRLEIFGENAWRDTERHEFRGTQIEHKVLFDAIRSGGATYVNNGPYMANSTGTALMGRLAAYTGKEVTWDDMLNDVLPKPEKMDFDALPPTLPNEKGEYKVYIPVVGWQYM